MNLLGKIFVVLILVMSLVFMGFAVSVYSTHRNWRDEASNLKAQLASLQDDLNKAVATKARIEADMAAERSSLLQQLAKLESERVELVKERTDLQNNEAKAQAEVDAAVAALNAAHESLEDQRNELAQLREEILKAQTERDLQFAEVVKRTDEVHVAQNDLAAARERNLLLSQQVARAKEIASRFNLNLNMDPDQTPPTVPGVVLASRENMIEVSIGSDDGLRPGHTLEVFRPSTGTYLGRVEVLRTEPDKAVAKVLPEFRRGIIQKEDHVATRLDR